MNEFEISNLKPLLTGKRVLVGITGSIAAFKACDIVRYLKQCGSEVRVVLTHSAKQFVTTTTLETLSGEPVLTDLWETFETGTHHIDTARWADVILIAPATAHCIGKLANGLADDLLTTEVLAFKGPVLVAPAMNPHMYSHPAVQENVEKLRNRNVKILDPAFGITSCGEEGIGRMQEPNEIIESVGSVFFAKPNEKSVLITLGPTQSKLDPVRYLTNRSSGKMGVALAWAALAKGYKVFAVSGPTELSLPKQAVLTKVQTAKEMAFAVNELWPCCHIFISSAAVLDWDVKTYSEKKLKKGSGTPKIELTKNIDILAEIGNSKTKDQFVLGFAAETDNVIANAIKKRIKKKCHAVFVNEVGTKEQNNFGENQNSGFWVSDKIVQIPKHSKAQIAHRLFDLIESEIEEKLSLNQKKDLTLLKLKKEDLKFEKPAKTDSKHFRA